MSTPSPYLRIATSSRVGAELREALLDEAFRTGDVDTLCAFAATARPEEYERFRTARRAEVRAAFVSADGRDPAALVGMAETETAYKVRLALAGVRGLPASDYDALLATDQDRAVTMAGGSEVTERPTRSKRLAWELVTNPSVDGRSAAARWAAFVLLRGGDADGYALMRERPDFAPALLGGTYPASTTAVLLRSRYLTGAEAGTEFTRIRLENEDAAWTIAAHLAYVPLALPLWQAVMGLTRRNATNRIRARIQAMFAARRNPEVALAFEYEPYPARRGPLPPQADPRRLLIDALGDADDGLVDLVLPEMPLAQVLDAGLADVLGAYLERQLGADLDAWGLLGRLLKATGYKSTPVGDIVAHVRAAVG